MLNKYLSGAIPQMIERGRTLIACIPRDLPRDYDALRKTCKDKVNSLIDALQILKGSASNISCPEDLRIFKRIVAEMDLLETVGVAALNRASSEDHRLNVLIEKITREIEYPLLTPTVTTLSQQYFCIYRQLNLLCIPLIEGKFLLHLPDLYHELAHPFFTEKNDPLLEPFQESYKEAIVQVLTHFEDEKNKAEYRRGPKQLYELLHNWQLCWMKFWLEEFFCDLFAVYTLGPAFVWSHLHLAIKRGGNPHELAYMRSSSHPCDHARMQVMLYALKLSGFESDVKEVQNQWSQFLEQISARPEPEYHRCYPVNLLENIADHALIAVTEVQAQIVTPGTQRPINALLNQAWQEFWKNPINYVDWEKQAIEMLMSELGES
ncbi:hypothetical protein RIVM261_048500 [Rivularia sp. IAM M-261]|nr:hypothetical protein RIVM261_048500 [Rivularia sp. IAM M-261]